MKKERRRVEGKKGGMNEREDEGEGGMMQGKGKECKSGTERKEGMERL